MVLVVVMHARSRVCVLGGGGGVKVILVDKFKPALFNISNLQSISVFTSIF